ncbi:MAG: MFS transporter [Candidatus Limnocylindrales bacterium]
MPDERVPATRSALVDRDFRRLWAAQVVSVYGTQVSILAIPLVAALILRVSPFEFGLLSTLEFVPFLLVSLPAGVWIDRVRRRPILVTADVVRCLALLSIPLAVVLDRLTIGQLYAVVFLNGGLSVFFDVAAQSYLPTILERDQLVDGNAKLELSRRTAQRLGPGIAGVLIGVVSAPFAVIADAASYLVSALFLSRIREREATVASEPGASVAGVAPPSTRSVRHELVEGLRFVAKHPWLRVLALSVAIGNLFGYVVDSILILHLVTERGFAAPEIGFAFTIGSIGVICGALLARRVTAVLGVGPTLLVAALGESVSWLPIAIAPDAWLFAGLATTITALGFFSSFWTINAISIRQAVTPAPLLGRVTATMRFISWGVIPLGALSGGILGSIVGLHATIWIGALGASLSGVPLALSSVSRVREMPAAADEPEGKRGA